MAAIELFISQKTRTVPKNAYWLDKVNDPDTNVVRFLKRNSKMIYAREFIGADIHEHIIIIKVGRFTHKNGFSQSTRGKRVKCLNTGEIYNSSSEAAEKTNVSPSSISRILRGQYKDVKGLKFKYV